MIESLKERGRPFRILGTARKNLPDLFRDLGFTVGAEVGVYRGWYSRDFCEKGFEFYAIDPWLGYVGAGRTEQKQEEQDLNYKIACETLAPYPNCTIIRKTSMEALKDFKDESLDFVFIDGDHRFQYIAQDIVEWSKKVRKGGVVAGHDYWNTGPEARNLLCQVKSIVDAYTSVFDIDFFITGEGRAPSWFFIKQ